jgi:hypothetical protein
MDTMTRNGQTSAGHARCAPALTRGALAPRMRHDA